MAMKSWAGALAAVMCALGAALVTASPATASTVHCTGYSTRTLQSGELSPNSAPYVPTTVTGGSTACRLDYGDGITEYVSGSGNNWGVVGLQRNLNRCYQEHFADFRYLQDKYGFAPLLEDGKFGPNTKNAMMKVQAYLHDYVGVTSVPVNGVYDDPTRVNLLFWNGGTVNGEHWLSCDFLA
ncbi:peptidoglycan-binding protein [Streptomyces sp. NPDC096205]|uniref:peptidoglycan-binding domain-containing protein n=1 Tax=Streptomyces sp. NPDC096205 TaxID=3366081 RepID=UPI00380A4435